MLRYTDEILYEKGKYRMYKSKHKEKMALFSGKRIAAFVLAFLLCVGTLPINSFAVEGDDMSQDAPAAADATLIPLVGLALSGGGKASADIEAGQFWFEVTQTGGDPTAVSGVPTGLVTTKAGVPHCAAVDIEVGTWTFTKVGTYTFTVVEQTPPAGYAVGGDATRTFNVKVEQKDGQLYVSADSTVFPEVVFFNTYTYPDAVKDTVSGSVTLKAVDGNKAFGDGDFSVKITENAANDTTGYTGFVAGDKDVSADGSFSFDEISFSKVGTYKFTVTQNNKGAAGYTYDDASYEVTVTVELDTTTNTLKKNVTYTKNGVEATDIIFNNYTYPPHVMRDTTFGFVTLKGWDGYKAFGDGDFSVKITENAANDTTGYTGFVAGDKDVSADGSFSFDEISFSKVGTYKFTVTQNDKGAAGYTYDDASYEVTVTVELHKVLFLLQKTVTYTKNGQPVDKLEFNNTYTSPDAITDTTIGSVTLKDEDGNDKTFNDGDFSVKIVANDANDTTGYTGFVAGDKDVAADGSFSFDEISFSKAGTYKFTVAQNDKGAAGYTYDDASYEVTVTVELDKATNTLKKTIIYTKDYVDEVREVVFNNTYATPAPSDITFSGNKTLKENGVDKAMEEGQFSFTIEADASTDATGYTGFTAGSQDVAANGSFSFGTVSFTKVGVYKFTISEVDKGAAGYHYDANAVTVTVTVELDTATNTLVATATYEKAGETADGITFANTYDTPDAVDQDLTGNVSLGGNRKTSDIKAGDFTFKVTPDAGNDESGYTLPNTAAASKDGGDIDFSKITFTKEGTYKFTISQDNLGKEGYTYDDSTYVVTVTVTLDKATNKLVPVIKLEKVKDGVTTAVDAISFANSYKKPTPANPSVEPSKPSDRPQTGDTTNVAVWGGLFLLSAALLVVCCIAGWKRRKTSNTK